MPISVHHRGGWSYGTVSDEEKIRIRGGWSYGTVSDEEKIRIRDNVASDNEMNNLYN